MPSLVSWAGEILRHLVKQTSYAQDGVQKPDNRSPPIGRIFVRADMVTVYRRFMTIQNSTPELDLFFPPSPLDGWLVPPHTAPRRSRRRDRDRKGAGMTRPLVELVEQFCQYQLKQRGKTEGGVQAYRWNLEQFLVFTRARLGHEAYYSGMDG